MRHRLPVALIATTVLAGAPIVAPTVAGAAGHGHGESHHTAGGPVVVPVTVQGGQGSAIGARPMVQVRVGNSKPVPVLLDTGSTGLHIFAPVVNTAPGGGVKVTSQPNAITYAGGSKFTGVVASAVIKIGPQATATKVPFGLIEQASCVAAKPACPTAGGIAGAMKNGEYGILGIGTDNSRQGVISPILGMPGSLGRRWSLHLNGNAGALVLGANVPSGSSVATVQLAAQGTSGAKRFWADQRARLCLAVGAIHTCAPGLFDSGTFQMQLWGSPLDTAPTDLATGRVLAGTPVAVSLPGAATPFWSFTAGTTKSKDTVTVKSPGAPFVNYGVQAFYTFTITYDDPNGTLTLTPQT